MGLFSKIGKAVKSVGKMVSLKNVVGVATGAKGLSELKKEATGRIVKAVTKTPAPSVEVPTGRSILDARRAARSAVSPSTAKTAGGGLTGNATVDAAIGGALAGAGVQIAGTDVGNAAGGAVAQSALNTWLKANAPWLIAVGAAIAGYFAFFRNKAPKGKKVLAPRSR